MKETYRSPPFVLEGYLAVTVKYSNGKKRTLLQHREVMEAKLGRRLTRREVVHHKDGCKTNNSLHNLELMSLADHGAHHAVRAVPLSLTCVLCGTKFERLERSEKHSRKQAKKGPYCSKSCAGKASRQLQIDSGMSNLRTSRRIGRAT